MNSRLLVPLISILAVAAFSACGGADSALVGPENSANQAEAVATPLPTPSNKFSEADIAKLKWLEGTWRGMDGEKPFFERIRFEGTTMVVEMLKDEKATEVAGTTRFELKNGEFGHTADEQRSAASSITDNSVQFVPDRVSSDAPPKGNIFRFERQGDGTWNAILEVPAKPKKAASLKTYKMEPWTPGSR